MDDLELTIYSRIKKKERDIHINVIYIQFNRTKILISIRRNFLYTHKPLSFIIFPYSLKSFAIAYFLTYRLSEIIFV